MREDGYDDYFKCSHNDYDAFVSRRLWRLSMIVRLLTTINTFILNFQLVILANVCISLLCSL
jgi:hypothetical protein